MKNMTKILTITLILILSATFHVQAGEVAGLNEFKSGQPALASEVNENFTAIKTAVDDNFLEIKENETAIAIHAKNINENANRIDELESNMPGEVKFTVLNVSCTALSSFNISFSNIGNIGTFTKDDPDSTVEVAFNGRIYVGSFNSFANGARFELRVDGSPTTNGQARAVLKSNEAGADGVPVSITGIFTGLRAGSHTVGLYVAATGASKSAGGSNAGYDPGCWSADHVIVKEYK